MSDSTIGKKNKKNIIRHFFQIREIGALIPLVIIFTAASLSNEAFISLSNLLNMLRATSYLFIVAVGMTFVLCGRGLDLSVGSQVGLSGIILGILMVWWRVPVWIAIPTALIIGAAAGAINGFLITIFRIPPFIATLATYYSYRGILQGITKAAPIGPMPQGFRALGQGSFLGIAYVIWFIIALLLVATFVFRKMKFGRYTLAMGGNAESTRLAGINTRRLSFSLYVISGVLASIAAIFFNSRFSSAQTGTGTGMELQAIAACIIGGVSLFGGSGSILGTLIGCMFLTVLENGMIMDHISGYWQQAVVGLIIIIAIVIDLIRKGDLVQKA
ncbi:MAG: ABC transporter permease [Spirochaetales bacterium]|nr:MAG: ABC transporter permease [Spirochaetales bacterium]